MVIFHDFPWQNVSSLEGNHPHNLLTTASPLDDSNHLPVGGSGVSIFHTCSVGTNLCCSKLMCHHDKWIVTLRQNFWAWCRDVANYAWRKPLPRQQHVNETEIYADRNLQCKWFKQLVVERIVLDSVVCRGPSLKSSCVCLLLPFGFLTLHKIHFVDIIPFNFCFANLAK